MDRALTGKSGEELVAAFLRKNGWTVIKQNYHSRFGEIDIIAENGEYIIFTEVKTRKKSSLVSGAEAVDVHKQQRIILTAQDFLSKLHSDLQPRFDVAVVTVHCRNDGSYGFDLNYIENAF